MKRMLMGVTLLVALLVVAVSAATAGGGQVIFGGQDQTICHATASEDGGNQHNGYDKITVSVDSIVKENGHGSHTDIGGKSDIIPAFDYTKTVKGQGQDPDVTTNEHYPGLGDASLINSNCAATPPPVDVCPNIEGNQGSVPEGMVKDEEGNCVTPPPPTDVCPNIEGDQATVPEGMVQDEQGNCVTPPPPPTDVCPNLPGVQTEGPCDTPPPRLCPDGQPPTPGEGAFDPNDDCKRPPVPPVTPPAVVPPTTVTPPAVTPPAVTPPVTKPPVVKPKAKPKKLPKPDKPVAKKKVLHKTVHICNPIKYTDHNGKMWVTKRVWTKGFGCIGAIPGSG